jgi:two-component system cell cycle sensor histidine kinase/response regulator CckA
MNPSPDVTDHRARILIVDDERHNRHLLEAMLMAEGFLLVTAASGEEALAMVAQEPPDLILLDIMMPGMGGYQVAGKIKGDPATKNIPIIIVSALDDRKARMSGLGAGAEAFLTKPVNRDELCVRVRNLLRLKAYGDYHDKYSQMLQDEVGSRTADLVESERLYRSTFDAAPVGIVHVGLDGRWLRVNQHLCDLLGYPPNELQGGAAQELIQSEAAAGEAAAFRRMVAGSLDRYVIDEKRYRCRDGSFMWARVAMSVHRDGESQSHHFITVIEDITERRALAAEAQQAVARLTASEQRYRTLLESANDAIAVLTPEGIVREVNHRWVAITGRRREELIGRQVRDLAANGHDDQIGQAHDQAVTTPASRSPPTEIATSSGAVVLMEFSRTTIEVGGERLVLAIGRDVTEQRRLEEQLRQAQKLEVIGQLAGGIAHDFNNILTAIIGFSEFLIADLPDGSSARADVMEIKLAAERAAGLTQQLLAFSRKQILLPKVLDINQLIAGMQPMLRRLIVANVELVVSLHPDVRPIKIDPTQLEQIVVNLSVNAADAMPRGGTLTIETANVRLDQHYRQHHLPVAPGDYVLLTVSDTGVGMDAATCQRMFEPFFTTKEVGRGTGLGLATVHGIVKQSGGDIWVYSEPGHGSTFKIYLPRAVATAAEMVALSYAAPEEVERCSETILLVEDDEAVRRLARLTLERVGYRVVEADSPKMAFRLAGELGGPIDLLLSDVIMPDSEGPPLFLRLGKLHPELRVLYMSGYADEAILRNGVITEGTPFLQKPFTPLTLRRKVREALEGPRAGPAIDHPRPPIDGRPHPGPPR